MATDLRVAMGEPARLSGTTPMPESWLPPSERASRAATPGQPAAPGSAWGRALLIATFLVLLALLATRLWPGRRAEARRVTSDASVAVLPLETGGASVEDEYLSEGLSEEIIGRLAQVEGLKVISPTSTVALKGRHLTVRQVADTLGVRHVLDGSLRRSGGQIQAKVELTDAQRGVVIWRQTYTLGAGELLQLQDVIARQVSGALLTADGRTPMPAAPVRTTQVAAYDAYLKGAYWLERRTPEGLRLATAAFEQAVELDPSYAQALAGLASASTYGVVYGYRSEADPYTELARSLQLAGRAVARDSGAAEAWLALADARSIAFYPEDSVRGNVLRARKLRPNSADIAMAYAWALFRAGAGDSALAQARRALALDPLAPGLRHALVALAIGARRYDVALREVRTTGAGGVVDPVSAILESYAQLLSGQADRCAERDPGPWVAVRAMCLHQLGRSAEAARARGFPGSRAGRGALPVPASVRRPRRLLCLARRCGAVGPLAGPGRRPLADAAPVAAGVRAVRQGAPHARVRRRLCQGPGAGGGAAPRTPRGDRRMSQVARASEFRCDVPTVDQLTALVSAPLPLGLVVRGQNRVLVRDVYLDTADNALAAHSIVCRVRYGADDRRTLTVSLAEPGVAGAGPSQVFESAVTPVDLAAILASDTAPARRLRGVVDLARLESRFELEIDRIVRTASRPWYLPGRFVFLYDRVTVRSGGLMREFQELKVRRLASGPPRLEELALALEQGAGLRPVLQTKLVRARALLRQMGAGACHSGSRSGRAVAVLALDGRRSRCSGKARTGGSRSLPARASRRSATGSSNGSGPRSAR